MKGIILAGGTGTRLYPATLAVSKQLLPIYDKPMIYYPLSVLMLADIREILIISTGADTHRFEQLLGDGSQLGCRFEYLIQPTPAGIAQALLIGEGFIGMDCVALILGDNFFFGAGLGELVRSCRSPDGAIILAKVVADPHRYGVVQLDSTGDAVSIEEKPADPKSPLAITGLYFYDGHAISCVNRVYMEMGQLATKVLGRGMAWLDTGSFDSMNDASNFVRVIEQRQGTKIGCVEEVAFSRGFIDRNQLLELSDRHQSSGYGSYLRQVANAESYGEAVVRPSVL